MQATRVSLHRRRRQPVLLSWTVASAILGLTTGACGSHGTDARPSSTGGAGSTADAGSGTAGAAGQAGSAGTTSTAGGSGSAGTAASAGTGGVAGAAGSIATVTEPPVYDSGSDVNRNAVRANQICERLSAIQCAGEEHCCDKPGRTKAQCYASMLNVCTTQLHLDEIAARSNAGFSTDAAKLAFDTFDTYASQCDTHVATWGISVAGLRGILLGTIAANGNCAPPGFTVTDPVADGAALASCKDLTTHACLPGSLGLSWKCQPKSDVNGQCFTDVNCKDGLYCDNPQLSLSSHPCLTRKEVGAACVGPNECKSLYCKHSVCVTADQQAAYCLAN